MRVAFSDVRKSVKLSLDLANNTGRINIHMHLDIKKPGEFISGFFYYHVRVELHVMKVRLNYVTDELRISYE